MKNNFQPDYTNILKVLNNQRPDYLPLYEHNIDEPFIAKMLGREVDSTGKSGRDLEEHYRIVTEFWKSNTYDALSYEAKICEIYPDHGAILGGRLGPIQNRDDFNKYPWEEIPQIFSTNYLNALIAEVGGIPINGQQKFLLEMMESSYRII